MTLYLVKKMRDITISIRATHKIHSILLEKAFLQALSHAAKHADKRVSFTEESISLAFKQTKHTADKRHNYTPIFVLFNLFFVFIELKKAIRFQIFDSAFSLIAQVFVNITSASATPAHST